MNVAEWIKLLFKKEADTDRTTNPNDARKTFISDEEKIIQAKITANKIWYIGDGDELLNYYTEKQAIGFYQNPIYNRNKRNYFWSLSAEECAIKRVHSGIPYAIISTISNIIGMPTISVKVNENGNTADISKVWDRISEKNQFKVKLTQQGRQLTLAEGFGAWKVNIRPELADFPIWEYYEATDVEYIVECGILTGIIFKNYYKVDKDDYILFETRGKKNGSSYIHYNLFKLYNDNTIEEVPINTVPELEGVEDKEIPGLDEILGVPARYFYDPLNSRYGRSIYDGKLDLFDDLDQILSQDSQTVRVSTPVEYYSPDTLERGPNGQIGIPHLYNRQFVQKAGIPDGEGNMSADIITTQPDLHFDKYSENAMSKLNFILTGVLSPATLGIDVAKKDNAEAQREKEKITIQTRNNIIASETDMLIQFVKLSLYMQEYLTKGTITMREYEISIKYNEFANPSFESELQILGPAWANNEISTKQYIDLLWGDKLSDEDKKKEEEYLEQARQQGMDMEGMLGNANENANRDSFSLPEVE